ncbi:MAG: GAF domain-containing protein [Leptospirales bacterium]|nr:GAF domain-containing protein [Leptospirales bacterium]
MDKIAILEKQVANLYKLVDINTIINSTLSINHLLFIIMDIIKEIMATEASTLLLYDEDSESLIFKVAIGEVGEELRENYRVKMGQGVAGWVALHRESLTVNDAYSDPRFDSTYDQKTGFVTKSMLSAPLLFKGKLLGVIQAINPIDKGGFDNDDVSLFNFFSNQAALAVQNAIFFQKAIEAERLEGELQAAKMIQESLSPAIDFIDDKFEIAARSLSAREVGGAFHFFREDEEGIYLVAMCNLNTKGIPGAMRASTLSGLIRAMDKLDIRTPSIFAEKINDIYKEEKNTGADLSIFIALINVNTMNIKFVNFGDAFPILVRDDKVAYLRFQKKSHGNIGEDNFKVSDINFPLFSGDIFTIFSSSLPEVKNIHGKQLSQTRIISFFEQKDTGRGEVIDSLLDYVREYTGGVERRKDISVLSFVIKDR